jgi:heme/copper-type cytochrome/quinol oxidase subunit 2
MTKHKKYLIALTIVLSLSFLLPALTCWAGDTITDQMKGNLKNVSLPTAKADQNDDAVLNMIGQAINIFLSLLGMIFMILIIYAGYKWMMALGREEEVSSAKEIIRSAIMGLIVVLSAYAITFFIMSRLQNIK